MCADLFIDIISRASLVPVSEGVDFLRMISDLAPELEPQSYGNYEPLRRKFDPQQAGAAALESWRWPFLWKRSKPSFEGGVWQDIGPQPEHAWITISGRKAGADEDHLISFLTAASVRFDADFALVHMLTEKEILRLTENGTVMFLRAGAKEPHLSLTPKRLYRCIPDVYWGTVLGPAYLEHFGRDKVLSSPAPIVRKLGANHVYIQLSQELSDLQYRWDEVESVRQAVKLHLNQDSFFDPEKGFDYTYNVPEFRLASRM